MKILYAASEARPFIASGGLADVAGSLPAALGARGVECRVVLPLYSDIPQELRDRMRFVTSFTVPLAWRMQYCGLFEAEENGVRYYLLDNEYYFKRSGLYGHFDDAERFAFFSKAVLEMMMKIDYLPDIIHCNDWQTAMIPVFLNCFYRGTDRLRYTRTVFTIHNIQYQGKFGMEVATDVCGLPKNGVEMVEYDACANYMKGAIEQCDMVTTVSPAYASEILDPWFSFGLDKILREKQYKLCGILNGIDKDAYDPLTDPEIYKNYSAKAPAGKAENKAKLQKELGLKAEPARPLIGMVSRLVALKGFDLVRYIFDEIASDAQVVVLGTGDAGYESFFADQAKKYAGRVAFRRGFDPAMARKIYAGSDLFLMPSKSEPCGLSQMLALRYGSVPVVRETGGLRDSIVDRGSGKGNGFTFKTYNAHDMMDALRRAEAAYADRAGWRQAVVDAMKCDFSWQSSAGSYEAMYKKVMADY